MPSFALAVTPLASPFLVLIAIVLVSVLIWSFRNGSWREAALLALFASSLALVVVAQSVLAFVFAWETMALISAFLVASHHNQRLVRRAALSYVIMSQVATACIIASLAILAAHAQSDSFAEMGRSASSLPSDLRMWVLCLALVGFGSKAGLVPLHFWLPSAHPAAPSNASAMLSGVMLAVAIYGLALFGLSLAAPFPWLLALIVIAIGAGTAFFGALYAAVVTDMKRLLAYSSIENTGITVAVLGLSFAAIALGAPTLAGLAVIATLLHILSHGVFKSLLFLGAGSVLRTTGTTDLEHLGGVFRTLRFSTPLILIGSMSAAALPPTSGFASEWLVFRAFVAATADGPIVLRIAAAIVIVALATAGGLAALAFAKFFGIGFLGVSRSSNEANEPQERMDASVTGLALLAMMSLAIGLAPIVALTPLSEVARIVTGAQVIDVGALPILPATIVLLPLVGAVATVLYSRMRGVREVPTWTCGSPVTSRSQYTAITFSKAISLIYGFLLRPARERITESGVSPLLPRAIRYVTSLRYPFDEAVRTTAAFVQRFARRTRIIQGGMLRVYLAYAVVAVITALVLAR